MAARETRLSAITSDSACLVPLVKRLREPPVRIHVLRPDRGSAST
jgi:hypothetical protein